MGEAPRNNPARAWRTRDWSRFFLSKTKERFKKPFRYPLAGSLFSNGILMPESRRASVFLPLPPASLRALALCSLSPALPGSPLSLPSPSLPLLPPPAPFPLRGSLASALGSRARAPLLCRGLGAGAPKRLATRGAGAAEQRHSAAVAAAARRRRRGTLAERARPPAVPWTDLLPGPKTDGLPELPRKTPKSSALLPPHPHLQPRAGCALSPPPHPTPAPPPRPPSCGRRRRVSGSSRPRSPGPPVIPRVGGGAIEKKNPVWRLGCGEGATPSSGGYVQGWGTGAESLPGGAREKKDPSDASRRRLGAARWPGSSPLHTYTCAFHAKLENFPRTPVAHSPPARLASQPFEIPFPYSLLPGAGRRLPSGRPDRHHRGSQTCPNHAEWGRRGLAPYAGGSAQKSPSLGSAPGLRPRARQWAGHREALPGSGQLLAA